MTILFYTLGWFIVGLLGALALIICENILNDEHWDKFNRDTIFLTLIFAAFGPFAWLAFFIRFGFELLAVIFGVISDKVGDKNFYLTGRRGRDE